MDDIRKTGYAEFLEAVCKRIMAYSPKAISVQFVCKDGNIGSSYYKCSMCDKMAMAGMMQHDAVMDGLEANPDFIRRILEEENE